MRTRSAHRPLAALAAGLLVLGLAACGDDDDAGDGGTDEGTEQTLPGDGTGTDGAATDEGATRPAGDPGSGAINATDNQYDVFSVTVAPGANVSFANQGSNPHTVTADDGSFDTGTVSGGSSGSLTAPSAPGTYPFHCDIHASMTGALVVE